MTAQSMTWMAAVSCALGAAAMSADGATITYRTTGTTALPGAGNVVLEYSYNTNDAPTVPGGTTWLINTATVTLLLDGVDQGAATAAQHRVTLTQPGPIGDDRYIAEFSFASGVDVLFAWVDDIDPTSGFITGPMLPGAAFDPFAATLNEWEIFRPADGSNVTLTGFEVTVTVIPLPGAGALACAGLVLLTGRTRRRQSAGR